MDEYFGDTAVWCPSQAGGIAAPGRNRPAYHPCRRRKRTLFPPAAVTPTTGDEKECMVTHSADFGPDLAAVFGPSQADGGPELVQLLTPEGERVEHPDFRFEAPDGQDEAETIRGFYRDMVLTRRIDTEATALQRHGELGIWAQLLGQEAAQIGAGRALRPQDYVFPTYREHGVAYCRGIDPLDLLGLFRGVDHGAWDPKDFNFGHYTIVIGAQALHATGYAMGVQRDGAVGTGDPDRDTAVLAHFGDGASSQGDVNESFIFAASYNSPVVFFCQNNQWAISEPIERQSRIPLYQRALGFGFPGVRVDGNDVLASYAVTQAALQRARDGQGPTFVEAYTYRMGAHTTTDDPTRYRLSDDVEHWKLKDPIQRVKVYLTRSGLADDAFFDAVQAEADDLGHHLREGCKALPDPKPLDMFDHVYAEETPELAAQRESFAAYLASFEASATEGASA
jgi:2-oxoisovalerate dehydrogenase E1 component alpha subunit